MIPVIIGAALAGAAGIGYALGKDDKPKPEQIVVKKAEVSEDYVKWCAERAGKNIDTNTQATPSEDFSADFERIEQWISNLQITNYTIKNELQLIELRAKKQHDDKALNFVAYYREKLRNRRR